MKKVFLFILSYLLIATIKSQTIVKEHYTVSGGVLGAVNVSHFRLDGANNGNIDYDFKAGWAAGGWLNLPVSKAFSIEPQVMYSSYDYQSNASTPILINNGTIRYISVPLLLKFHLGDMFAITAGPQVDFTVSVDDNSMSNAQENDFKQTSFSAFGGFELFPHGRATVFGRYIHGFTNMNNTSSELTPPEFKNQNIQAGLKLKLFGKKIPADSDGDGVSDPNDKCPGEFGFARYDGCPIPDTDKDGINDEEDKCPGEAGIAKYGGCPIPDTDKDGINDEEDKCPNEPGTAKYNGCPIPDTDKDGINDEEDKCPNEAGTAKYNGCPIPDRDNDGINDEEDKCPDVPGVASRQGCPEAPPISPEVSKMISSTGQSITFSTGSTKLTSKSYASLNKVIKILHDNPDLKLKIEGHTDNVEKDDDMKISEGRASAAKAYIVSKGISEDRLEVEGYGATMPISDNNTATGRSKNRRVEIKVTY